jgi:muramoyltetrapeptide carboxypeptidase LdcA involved in peptidoglycan recycling
MLVLIIKKYESKKTMKIYPEKLKQGDSVAIIAPSMSFSLLSQETIDEANRRFAEIGLHLKFGKNIKTIDEFLSSTVQERIDDLHWAFSDTSINAIFTVIGGYNCNQLLDHIDWELIKNNPKIFCGYSDITALQNAIFAKTGLITYSGPHYSSFGQKKYFDYTLNYFMKCLFSEDQICVTPSKEWSDDEWYIDQANRSLIANNGYHVINNGNASGTLIGGNLITFKSLQGTHYFPSLKNAILFLEDDAESGVHQFDRDLQSLILLDEFKHIKGLIIGRFQKESSIAMPVLEKIIKNKKELNNIPVIANVDFGHTNPFITLPIGGDALIEASPQATQIIISKH